MNLSNALFIRIIGLISATLWITLLATGLPEQTASTDGDVKDQIFSWNAFLIGTNDPMYPFNIQILMWIAFFLCVAEAIIKWLGVIDQRKDIANFSLYENPSHIVFETEQGPYELRLDPQEAIKPEILAGIYYAKKDHFRKGSFITDLFKKVNYQFNGTNDVADVYSTVTTSIELALHQVDLRYTVLRYMAWLIPTLGFIGTVIGIALALGTAGAMDPSDPQLLNVVVPKLAIAFYTTLLALLLSAIVMLLVQVIQAQDEEVVSEIGSFFIDQIVTNLKPRTST